MNQKMKNHKMNKKHDHKSYKVIKRENNKKKLKHNFKSL